MQPLLTPKEVAHILGTKTSYVYEAHRQGLLEGVRLPNVNANTIRLANDGHIPRRLLRFTQEAVASFLRSR